MLKRDSMDLGIKSRIRTLKSNRVCDLLLQPHRAMFMDPEIFPLAEIYYLCEEVWSIAPPPAMPVCTKSEQTGVGPCYEISQSSVSIICRKNINVKWQFLSSDLLV